MASNPGFGRSRADGRRRGWPIGPHTNGFPCAIWRGRIRAPWLAVLVALPLSGCELGVLDPQGPIGMSERTIMFNALAIMLAIIVPTFLATLVFAW